MIKKERIDIITRGMKMYVTKEEYIKMTKDLDFDQLEKDISKIYQTTVDSLGSDDVQKLRECLKKQQIENILGHTLIMGSLEPLSYIAGIVLMAASRCRDVIAHEAMHRSWDHESLKIHMTEDEKKRVSPESADWRSWGIDSEGWKCGHNRKHHPNTGLEYSDPDVLYAGVLNTETGESINEGGMGLYGGYLRTHEEAPSEIQFTEEFWGPFAKIMGKAFTNIDYRIKYAFMALMWTQMMAFHHANSHDDREKRAKSTKDVIYRNIVNLSKDLSTAAANPLILLFGKPMYVKTAVGYLASTFLLNIVQSTFIWQGHHTNGSMVLDEKIGPAGSLGEWYYRQIICSNDFTSDVPFLAKCYRTYSYGLDAQTIHHLFPALPHTRFDEVRKEVIKVCDKHKIKYNISSLKTGFKNLLSRLKKHND